MIWKKPPSLEGEEGLASIQIGLVGGSALNCQLSLLVVGSILVNDALGSCLVYELDGLGISGLGGVFIVSLQSFVIAAQSGLDYGTILAVAEILLPVGACTLDSRFDVCHSIYPLFILSILRTRTLYPTLIRNASPIFIYLQLFTKKRTTGRKCSKPVKNADFSEKMI
jgi:hypothetical protein